MASPRNLNSYLLRLNCFVISCNLLWIIGSADSVDILLKGKANTQSIINQKAIRDSVEIIQVSADPKP